MSFSISLSFRTLVTAAAFGAMIAGGPVLAASQCKGVAQDACLADSQCTWVEGYTRKDGRSVSSHCKTRPSRKDASQAALDTPRVGQLR